MPEISVIIVDDAPSTLENVQKLLSFEKDIRVIGTASSGESAIQACQKNHPDIVLLDINLPDLDGIRVTDILSRTLPNSSVIIMSVQDEKDYIRRAMQVGAREYLFKPFTHEELTSAIRRVYQMETFKIQQTLLKAIEEKAPEKPKDATIVAVVSGKGGVGKTLVASNLAVALNKKDKSQVVIIDLSLHFGTLNVFFERANPFTLAEWSNSEKTEENLKECLTETSFPGIKLVLAPNSPEYGDFVHPTHLIQLITYLRTRFDYIILDTGDPLTEPVLTLLENLHWVLLLTNSSFPSLKTTANLLKLLPDLKVEEERILVLFNQTTTVEAYTRETIEKSIQHRVSLTLPNDTSVDSFVNKGVPFMRDKSSSSLGKAFQELALILLPEEKSDKEISPQNKMGWLFGK